jgi:hypothetical protein
MAIVVLGSRLGTGLLPATNGEAWPPDGRLVRSAAVALAVGVAEPPASGCRLAETAGDALAATRGAAAGTVITRTEPPLVAFALTTTSWLELDK